MVLWKRKHFWISRLKAFGFSRNGIWKQSPQIDSHSNTWLECTWAVILQRRFSQIHLEYHDLRPPSNHCPSPCLFSVKSCWSRWYQRQQFVTVHYHWRIQRARGSWRNDSDTKWRAIQLYVRDLGRQLLLPLYFLTWIFLPSSGVNRLQSVIVIGDNEKNVEVKCRNTPNDKMDREVCRQFHHAIEAGDDPDRFALPVWMVSQKSPCNHPVMQCLTFCSRFPRNDPGLSREL
jgi:hypothetical protein